MTTTSNHISDKFTLVVGPSKKNSRLHKRLGPEAVIRKMAARKRYQERKKESRDQLVRLNAMFPNPVIDKRAVPSKTPPRVFQSVFTDPNKSYAKALDATHEDLPRSGPPGPIQPTASTQIVMPTMERDNRVNAGARLYDERLYSDFPYFLLPPHAIQRMSEVLRKYREMRDNAARSRLRREVRNGVRREKNMDKVVIVSESFHKLAIFWRTLPRPYVARLLRESYLEQVNLNFSPPGPHKRDFWHVALAHGVIMFPNGPCASTTDYFLGISQISDPVDYSIFLSCVEDYSFGIDTVEIFTERVTRLVNDLHPTWYFTVHHNNRRVSQAIRKALSRSGRSLPVTKSEIKRFGE